MSAAPESCSAVGSSPSSTIPSTTEPTGWTVRIIDVIAAGRRGSEVEISSQPSTCEESASRISQPADGHAGARSSTPSASAVTSEAVGAGLATVLANVQVLFVGLIAWVWLGERPESRSLMSIPVVFAGVVLISGAIGAGAYGNDPALGVLFGVLTGISYALFLLILRQGNSDIRRPAGPLFDATASGALFSAIGGIAVGDIDWLPDLEAQAWLVLLALSSQVLGWLLISVSLPRLPALLTSIVLMLQPVSAVFLAALLLSEAPSSVQLLGVAIVIAGVAFASTQPRTPAAVT